MLVSPQICPKRLACDRGACEAGLAVRADRAWLNQIPVNPIANASRFTDQGGSVDGRCEARGNRVELRVRDTGIGIPPEKCEAILEPVASTFIDTLPRSAADVPDPGIGS